MDWGPGAKPRKTGPGHHPLGVLTVSGVHTPQCQTPTPGILWPPSTGRLGIGNNQQPLTRTVGLPSSTLHTPSPHTRPTNAARHPPSPAPLLVLTRPPPPPPPATAPTCFSPSCAHPHPLPKRYKEYPVLCRMPRYCKMLPPAPHNPVPLPLRLHLWVVPYAGRSPPADGTGTQGCSALTWWSKAAKPLEHARKETVTGRRTESETWGAPFPTVARVWPSTVPHGRPSIGHPGTNQSSLSEGKA